MRIDIFIHEVSPDHGLDSLHAKVDTIMASQAEQAAKLRALGVQLAKARGEIIAAVDRLTAALAAAGGTTPEVDEATAALATAVQGLDDLNPDETPAESPATP